MGEAVSMIYFRSCHIGLAAARKAMIAAGLAVRRLDGPLAGQLGVRWADDPDCTELRVAYSRGRYVREEASGSGKHSPHATAMAQCDARFEILIDDLDETLDDLNTLMEVQWALEELAECYTVNSWNGKVVGPGE